MHWQQRLQVADQDLGLAERSAMKLKKKIMTFLCAQGTKTETRGKKR